MFLQFQMFAVDVFNVFILCFGGPKGFLGPGLAGLLSTTHQNVSLTLQLAPNVTFSRAYSSFKPTVEHGVVTLELGDLFSEERRDILVSLRCGEGLMSDWHTSCLFQRNPSWLMV